MNDMTKKINVPLPKGTLQRNKDFIVSHMQKQGFSVSVNEDLNEMVVDLPVAYPVGKLMTLGVEIGMADAKSLNKKIKVDIHD